MECQFLLHLYDSTPKKSRRKRDSNPGSSALEADALTSRPTRRCEMWGPFTHTTRRGSLSRVVRRTGARQTPRVMLTVSQSNRTRTLQLLLLQRAIDIPQDLLCRKERPASRGDAFSSGQPPAGRHQGTRTTGRTRRSLKW